MSSEWLRFIDLLIEGFFLGLGLSVFLSFLISLFKKDSLKHFHRLFSHYAIKLIRIIGIIYFIYFMFLFFKNLDRITDTSEDSDDLYRTIFFISRTILMVLLSQLFWFKKVRNNKTTRSLIIIIIFILALFAPYIIERAIFFLSYYSRDYWPASIENRSVPLKLKLTIILFFVEKIVYFSILVLTTWLISNKLFKTKNN